MNAGPFTRSVDVVIEIVVRNTYTYYPQDGDGGERIEIIKREPLENGKLLAPRWAENMSDELDRDAEQECWQDVHEVLTELQMGSGD